MKLSAAWKDLKKISAFNVLMLTIAGMINSCGVTIFLQPVQLYDSGISGTSMLLSQITPEWMSLSNFLILLNVPLFLWGTKKQGVLFTVYAVYSVAVYSVCAHLTMYVLPVDTQFASPLAGRDLLLCALFGGMISGAGSGLALRYGGAMDGIDIVAAMFAKGFGLSVGSFVMIYNVILYVICGIVIQSWILPLYSIVTYMAALKTVDFIVDGIDRAKCAMIVTVRPKEVTDILSENFGQGTTIVDAIGGFSGQKKAIVYFVVNRFQVTKMKNLVHDVDEAAYISLTEVADVFRANNK